MVIGYHQDRTHIRVANPVQKVYGFGAFVAANAQVKVDDTSLLEPFEGPAENGGTSGTNFFSGPNCPQEKITLSKKILPQEIV